MRVQSLPPEPTRYTEHEPAGFGPYGPVNAGDGSERKQRDISLRQPDASRAITAHTADEAVYVPLAQSVEQPPFKRQVRGS